MLNASERVAGEGDETFDKLVVFFAGLAFDAASDVDGIGTDRFNRGANIRGSETAGEDEWDVAEHLALFHD
jgi:hypothetical protein